MTDQLRVPGLQSRSWRFETVRAHRYEGPGLPDASEACRAVITCPEAVPGQCRSIDRVAG